MPDAHAETAPPTITEEAAAKLRSEADFSLELAPDPAGEGCRLNHPEAVLTTFC